MAAQLLLGTKGSFQIRIKTLQAVYEMVQAILFIVSTGQNLSSAIAYACKGCGVINLLYFHCNVSAVNTKTDSPEPNLTTTSPDCSSPTVSPLILRDKSLFHQPIRRLIWNGALS